MASLKIFPPQKYQQHLVQEIEKITSKSVPTLKGQEISIFSTRVFLKPDSPPRETLILEFQTSCTRCCTHKRPYSTVNFFCNTGQIIHESVGKSFRY